MPNSTSTRIYLDPKVLKDPRVGNHKGALVIWGSFPGGDMHRPIGVDETGNPYINGHPHQYQPECVRRYIRREASVAA